MNNSEKYERENYILARVHIDAKTLLKKLETERDKRKKKLKKEMRIKRETKLFLYIYND
jgi:hypothetical protein